LFTDKCSIP